MWLFVSNLTGPRGRLYLPCMPVTQFAISMGIAHYNIYTQNWLEDTSHPFEFHIHNIFIRNSSFAFCRQQAIAKCKMLFRYKRNLRDMTTAQISNDNLSSPNGGGNSNSFTDKCRYLDEIWEWDTGHSFAVSLFVCLVRRSVGWMNGWLDK